MQDALARALGVALSDVRRAVMLRGDLGAVAEAGLRDGAAGLSAFRLQVGQPLQPMLAQSAQTVAEAMERTACPAAIEWKLDGARVQIHVLGQDVRVFTRSLDDITSRVPELVEMAQRCRCSRWFWTARHCRCARTAGRSRFRSAPVGSGVDWTSNVSAQPCR